MPARRSAILGLVAGLCACGFRPLLKEVDDQGVRSELAAIEVQGLQSSRLGQLVHNQLLDELNPTGAAVPARYLLSVQVRERSSALGIQLDNTVTRYNLLLTARFHLLDRKDRRLLFSSTVSRIASYDVQRAPFATLVAEQDAERRAAEEVGRDIMARLAAHFSRQKSAT
ncbi:MAG: LPS assembly lipoprotein LptE [Geminicoccaceae bacterium]